MIRYLVVIIMLTVLSSCTVRNFSKVMEANKDYIIFGNGGGFTGAYNATAIDYEGRIYRQDNTDWNYAGRVSSNAVSQSFKNIKQLANKQKAINQPGNRYYILESNINGERNKWVWGAESEHDESLQLMYSILNALVKQ